jgi:hypothetical protein
MDHAKVKARIKGLTPSWQIQFSALTLALGLRIDSGASVTFVSNTIALVLDLKQANTLAV